MRRLYEKDEIYDLIKDPYELSNLIGDPSYADVLSDMKERLLTWYLETCDVVPIQTDTRF